MTVIGREVIIKLTSYQTVFFLSMMTKFCVFVQCMCFNILSILTNLPIIACEVSKEKTEEQRTNSYLLFVKIHHINL